MPTPPADRPKRTVFVIRIRGQVGRISGPGNPTPLDPDKLDAVPCYVKAYDPRAFGHRGDVDVTDDVRAALHFPTAGDALACYRQKVGKRPDGAWNRPLMAFTVSIEPVTLTE